MNNIKTVLDREPVSSEFIQSKQEFDKVLVGAKMSKPGIWKTSWFYGIVGTASIVFTVTVISLDSVSAANPSEVVAGNSMVIREETGPVSPETANASPVIEEQQPSSEGVRAKPKSPESVAEEIPLEESVERVESEMSSQQNVNGNSSNSKLLLAHFGDTYRGNISVDKICGGTGLLCNDEWAVTSFTLQFYTRSGSIEQNIRGNQVPLNICEVFPETESFELFITNIKAEHRSTGKTIPLNSVNIVATR